MYMSEHEALAAERKAVARRKALAENRERERREHQAQCDYDRQLKRQRLLTGTEHMNPALKAVVIFLRLLGRG